MVIHATYKLILSLLGLWCDEQWYSKIHINIIIKPYYIKLSLNNLSFRIPAHERLAPFSPFHHKSTIEV